MSWAARLAKEKAKARPLSEERALNILNSLPMMVACSHTKLLPQQIISSEYEICEGTDIHIFPTQPFVIVREITQEEYAAALPESMKPKGKAAWARFCRYFYEIHTD